MPPELGDGSLLLGFTYWIAFCGSEGMASSTDEGGRAERDCEGSEGKWGRFKSGCLSLKERWFVMETILLLKLAIPMVSACIVK